MRLLISMLAPTSGTVYDPCCGSGGMFVQSERFAREHSGTAAMLSFYGQESNATTLMPALRAWLSDGHTAFGSFAAMPMTSCCCWISVLM